MKKLDMKLTTVRRLFIVDVMARFISIAVGGSTRSDVFSSSERSGSDPSFVTQG
jgi:hypothetical protein